MHDKEYLVHVGGKSYVDSLEYCKIKGGKLAEPKSLEQNNDIVNLAKTVTIEGPGVWIGIDDKLQEGDFTYASDGKPIEYTNWNPNEPRTGVLGISEDCVILKKSYGFKWNDAVCSLIMSFICERDQHNYGNYWLADNCVDIDECSNSTLHPRCKNNMECVNIPGNYSCQCPSGFEGVVSISV